MTRRVRVVVVLDDVRHTVHGMTTSNDEARQWFRDLEQRYPDEILCARQFVAVVDVADDAFWDD